MMACALRKGPPPCPPPPRSLLVCCVPDRLQLGVYVRRRGGAPGRASYEAVGDRSPRESRPKSRRKKEKGDGRDGRRSDRRDRKERAQKAPENPAPAPALAPEPAAAKASGYRGDEWAAPKATLSSGARETGAKVQY